MKKVKVILVVAGIFLLITASALAAGSRISEVVRNNDRAKVEKAVVKLCEKIKIFIQQKEATLDEIIDREQANLYQAQEDKALEKILFKIRIVLEDEITILEEVHNGMKHNLDLLKKGPKDENLNRCFAIACKKLAEEAMSEMSVLEYELKGLKKALKVYLREKDPIKFFPGPKFGI